MQVTNQKPAVLSPLFNHDYTKPLSPADDMKTVICPQLRQPMTSYAPASIVDDAGNAVTDDDIVRNLMACCGTALDLAAETWCKDLFKNTLAYFNPNGINVQMLFSAQAGVQAKLPYPTPTMVYTPGNDIIPTCRDFMTGQCGYETLFATFAFYGQTDTLGAYFVNDAAFDAFKQYLDGQTAPIRSNLPPDTVRMLDDFKSVKLDKLSESLLLRNDNSQNNQPGSFARVLQSAMLSYGLAAPIQEYGLMPFRLSELFVPISVLFVNVERHMHATPKQIKAEWDIIRTSLTNPPPIVSNQKLTKLTAGVRAAQKIQQAAATATANRVNPQKAPMVPFSSKPPKTIDIARLIRKIMDKMSRTNRSENSYKSVKMTFQKPNRRDPDDFNKQGKSVSTKYLPDVHLYIDTSGSISEDNYKDAVLACIYMAKKLNINIYFNSFSDNISQCSLLHTRDKTVKQLYATFQKVQKVTGGTDFDMVWDYINLSKKRRRELSIMITDFEYTPRNRQVTHPKNLYYVPCANVTNYTMLVREATRFCKKCEHIDPNMRSRILF